MYNLNTSYREMLMKTAGGGEFLKLDQGGERSGSHWSLEWNTFCGKGRFAVGVAQRLRAGEPAPDPCSVCVRSSQPWTG